jgi:hypothetical protein
MGPKTEVTEQQLESNAIIQRRVGKEEKQHNVMNVLLYYAKLNEVPEWKLDLMLLPGEQKAFASWFAKKVEEYPQERFFEINRSKPFDLKILGYSSELEVEWNDDEPLGIAKFRLKDICFARSWLGSIQLDAIFFQFFWEHPKLFLELLEKYGHEEPIEINFGGTIVTNSRGERRKLNLHWDKKNQRLGFSFSPLGRCNPNTRFAVLVERKPE